ncbi:putative metal-dependent hydrolase [Heliobacterium chlorum]|uniref:Putative metal-dependent hydrolase H1S01_17110 n=1 Tax=Heliobacterium chlorum TaxID=2698 RepID=A0ABR7T932_HELCL|nr:putative metal-dependent hydrolase [Heliobacterium chlorum]MBC9786186.1 putative metal-dependent hydrolase [Heliobacterium chlorum]
MDELKYPIGRFDFSQEISDEQIPGLIAQIEALPGLLSTSVEGLSEEQWGAAYRPGGWTLRQVIHHIADSHINSFVRFKLALTEDSPMIKPYEEAKWAELDDAVHVPADVSLQLIDSLHTRWVRLLRALTPAQLNAVFRHPEIGDVSLRKAIGLYAWHGNHHLGHIQAYKKRNGLGQ